MKKRIMDIIVDILLIAAVFSVTDIVMLNVFHSENIWLELGVYIVFYAVVFGAKRGVAILWKRFISKKNKKGGNDNEKKQ